jgi:hypothetical protein
LEGRQIWLRFATWILLGLEFALAADILRTAVAPTWGHLRLAVIATIRTMLNYFLAGTSWRRQEPESWLGRAQPRQNRAIRRPGAVNQLDAQANMWFISLT